MASHEDCIDIGRPPEEVFDLLHDYSRRLQWDSFLRAAELLDGERVAGLGVRTRCTSRLMVGGTSMETIYVAFRRPSVAAVKLSSRSRLFETFAASIRLLPLAHGARTRVSYKYTLRTRPRWLRRWLEPLVSSVLARETRQRLRDLKRFLEGPTGRPPSPETS